MATIITPGRVLRACFLLLLSGSSVLVRAQAPTITDFCPKVISTGTLVSITGTNFTAGSPVKVKFSIFPEQTVTPVSSTLIQVTLTAPVPKYSKGHVTVTVGTKATVSTAYYTAYPAPVVTSVNPPTVPVGGTLTINGRNFIPIQNCPTGSTLNVVFNTSGGPVPVSATGTVNSVGTQLTATVPAGATGTFQVVAVGGSANGSFGVGPRPLPQPGGDLPVASRSAASSPTSFTTWPNPAHEHVTVSITEAPGGMPVQLLDALGRVIHSVVPVEGQTDVVFVLTDLRPGLYSVRCGATVSRLVIE